MKKLIITLVTLFSTNLYFLEVLSIEPFVVLEHNSSNTISNSNIDMYNPFLKDNNYSSDKKAIENKAKYIYIMNLISDFYHENMKKSYLKNENIISFFKSKNIDAKTIEKFHLGFSENFLGVINFLNKKGIENHTLLDLNIFKKNSKDKIYDNYAKRIIFPIKDKLNNTIGFGGRILEGNGPKYINSAENEFFKKRFLLYNMNNLIYSNCF